MTRSLLLAALAALAAGCETFVEADPADHDPVLSVSAVFAAGQPWSLAVGRTVALGDTTDLFGAVVENARVTITADDGTVLVLPHVGGGRYGAALRPFDPETGRPPDPLFEDGPAPETGRTYTLRIEAPGLPTVTASASAPRPAAVMAEAAGAWEPSGSLTGGPQGDVMFYSAAVSVRIAPAEPGAWYEVSAGRGEFGFSGFFTDAPTLTETTFVQDIGGGTRRREFAVFVDLDALAGQPFTIEVEGTTDPMEVVVRTASEAYYEAARQAARRRAAESNPFAEPVPAYSNLEGGVGLFAGVSETRVVVARPDP